MAEVYGTLKEIAVHMAKTQQDMVDSVTEETPVVDTIPFQAASHDMWNVAKNLGSVTGGGFGDAGAPLASMKVQRGLRRVDLKVLGGEVFIDQDSALQMGGPAAYFADNEPAILSKLGMDAEVEIIYNSLRAYALQNAAFIPGLKTLCGGAGNANYSILAVRWIRGASCGLYSPKMFKQGTLVKGESLSGGQLYKNPSDGVNGYGFQYKGYIGIQLLNMKTCAGLFNVTATNKPTGMQVDDMLASIRATDKNTFIYCHPKAMNVLADVGKSAAFRMGTSDKDVDRRIASWNGVRIVVTYNMFDGTEANVT